MNGNGRKPEEERPSKLLVIPGLAGVERSGTVILQTDLIEERLLQLAQQRAWAAWQHKRSWIRRALQRGAAVQPGPHSAELIHRSREGYVVPAGEFEVLVVR